MALTYDDLTGKINTHIIPRVVDTIYLSSPAFTRARTKHAERFEGGTSLKHPIMFAELNGGPFTRGSTFDISYVQTDTALEVFLKKYYVNITVFGVDNITARGPEEAVKYIESKFINASGKMAKLLSTAMFRDGQGVVSSPIDLDGLLAATDNGTNYSAYGGITRSELGVANGVNNQGINGYVKTITKFTLKELNTAVGATWFGNQKVDLIVTTQAIWDLIFDKILPNQRYDDADADVAKAGFRTIRWCGIQIVVDQYCPAGYIFGINSNHMQFWITTLQKYQFGWTGFKESQNTDDQAGQYLFGGNFLFPAPRLFFQLNGITG